MSRTVKVRPTSSVSHVPLDTFVRGALNSLWAMVVAALAYYALFQLPFWFPPRLRLWSASYAFAFNNGVAILAMAALLTGVAALLYVRQQNRASQPPIEFPLDGAVAGRRSLMM